MDETGTTLPAPSYASGPVDLPMIEETVGDVLDRVVRAHHDREALVDVRSGQRWSYGELLVDVERVARGLVAGGIRTGDRVGVWSSNCAEWTLLQLATAKLGVILVSIDPGCGPDDLELALNQTGVRLLVVGGSVEGSAHRATVESVWASCPGLAQLVVIGEESWAALLHNASLVTRARLQEIQRGLTPDDPISIQAGSGTGGSPGPVTLSHRNVVNNGFFVGEACAYTSADRVCIAVPFSRCFGMVAGTLAAVTHGASMVIPDPDADPATVLRAVRDEGCTSLLGSPRMLAHGLALVEQGGEFAAADLTTLRTGVLAGSGSSGPVVRSLLDAGVSGMTVCYGRTETSAVSTQTAPRDPVQKKVGTVGRVGPHLELKVVDPATREVAPRGTPGELLVRGYAVMIGYWDQPDETAEMIHDGWLSTGDLGVMDEDGYVQLSRKAG